VPLLRDRLPSRQRALNYDQEPWSDLIEDATTSSGVAVTPEKSLQVAACYACVRLLADSVAMLPVQLVRRRGRRREQLDPAESNLAWLMSVEPNSEMDAGELWRAVAGWTLLRGDGFVYVERNRGGAPTALWPLPTTSVNVGRTPTRRELVYQVVTPEDYRAPGVPEAAALGPANILHFRAFGVGGLTGLSPIGQVRESVGTAIAARQYAARFYQHDAAPGSYVSVDGELTDKQFERLKSQWRAAHEGLSKSHKLAVLEGGAKWESVSLNPKDAAFIESRKFETVEIARIYNVPPHMIQDVERSTSWGTGIEEQGIQFATYSLGPWTDRLERVTRRGLVTRTLGPRVVPRWSMDALTKGDVKTRFEAHATARQWGWESANDVLEAEDKDTIGPAGDVYLQPMNMVPAGTVTEPRDAQGGGRRAGQRQPLADLVDLRSKHVGELLSSLDSRMEAEREAVLDAIGPTRPQTADEIYDTEAHQQALAELLVEANRSIDGDFGETVEQQVGRSVAARYDSDDEWLRTNAEMTARAVVATTRDQIDQDLAGKPEQPASDVVDEVYRTHVAARLPSVALTQTTTVGQHAAHESASQAGAGTKTWTTTSGNPRSTHEALNGSSVPIDQQFDNGAAFPGDPTLPTPERAQCECVLTYS
jgi:HK97 family phage portal protein